MCITGQYAEVRIPGQCEAILLVTGIMRHVLLDSVRPFLEAIIFLLTFWLISVGHQSISPAPRSCHTATLTFPANTNVKVN